MKTTVRFENAVRRLYDAFHSGNLEAMDCKKCAVGNIVGSDEWIYNSTLINEMRRELYSPEPMSIDIPNYCNSGYSGIELVNIERIFMHGRSRTKIYFKNDFRYNSPESQFKGLCAVVEYLCELDNIPNPMDYSALFETENNRPKLELQSVFQ